MSYYARPSHAPSRDAAALPQGRRTPTRGAARGARLCHGRGPAVHPAVPLRGPAVVPSSGRARSRRSAGDARRADRRVAPRAHAAAGLHDLRGPGGRPERSLPRRLVQPAVPGACARGRTPCGAVRRGNPRAARARAREPGLRDPGRGGRGGDPHRAHRPRVSQARRPHVATRAAPDVRGPAGSRSELAGRDGPGRRDLPPRPARASARAARDPLSAGDGRSVGARGRVHRGPALARVRGDLPAAARARAAPRGVARTRCAASPTRSPTRCAPSSRRMLPFKLTDAQKRVRARDRRRPAHAAPDEPAAPGRRRLGEDDRRRAGPARRRRERLAGRAAGADRDPCRAALREPAPDPRRRIDRLPRRPAARIAAGPRAPARVRRPGHGLRPSRRRDARAVRAWRRLPAPGPRRHRRAAPVRRAATRRARGQGHAARRAGDDRDADPALAGADALRRSRPVGDRRAPARPHTGAHRRAHGGRAQARLRAAAARARARAPGVRRRSARRGDGGQGPQGRDRPTPRSSSASSPGCASVWCTGE